MSRVDPVPKLNACKKDQTETSTNEQEDNASISEVEDATNKLQGLPRSNTRTTQQLSPTCVLAVACHCRPAGQWVILSRCEGAYQGHFGRKQVGGNQAAQKGSLMRV